MSAVTDILQSALNARKTNKVAFHEIMGRTENLDLVVDKYELTEDLPSYEKGSIFLIDRECNFYVKGKQDYPMNMTGILSFASKLKYLGTEVYKPNIL